MICSLSRRYRKSKGNLSLGSGILEVDVVFPLVLHFYWLLVLTDFFDRKSNIHYGLVGPVTYKSEMCEPTA